MEYDLREVYIRVHCMFCQKRPTHLSCDAKCRDNGHHYRHDFTSPARVLGLPDGTLIMLPDGTAFEVSPGSMLVTDYD